ncbi:MAG: MFS transporter [Candidatus Dactylopiibacterium carminicum]|uniref:MFS transporter n=1 Tax=Candidatus Dactylopiibacterium carminicum TaxID=857335 RepID=A0A272EW18_9RHOO|nr:DHA2 family efflux MFS transporter permease subunit [Candidatus Dactylopiibacterium carminicum]KAF7599515.1 MFS transporter [Candidatus Dactylopiibacterium carminicum]PAS94291.1 MAG: MFS transporter [Candidatus Dactylopiibacterium carminicum]PAS99520.1 MAG: MFS transporter [Candidatus Dactylopiibacterium carminicum]
MAQAPATHFPPLEGGARVLATLVLALATFMNVLDTTIANVSIPAISGDLGVSPSQGTWVITSFAVANAISVPLTGFLAQRFGQVRLFVVSILLFVITSWLCGVSSSITMLITFRVLQGLVAGPMIPLSQTLLLQSYPPAKAGMALAAWSMTTLVAPVMGPILGGWLSDNLSWPWIFYINVPTGLLAAWMTWRLLRHREMPTRKLPIDTVGLILLVVWVGALQIMLDKGKELDWFNSGEIILLGVVALVSFCFFLVWELTDEHPVVDLRLFMRRNFLVGTIAISMGYCVFFGNVVIMPLWMQQYMGYTATLAGLATAPVGILALLLSPIIGKYMPRLDARRVATTAFVIFAITAFLRAKFSTDVTFMGVVIPQFIQGAAMACFFVPLTGVVLSGLQPHQMPAATGLTNFVRITAGAFGASLFTTLWENRSAMHHAQLAESISQYRPAAQLTLDGLMSQGMSQQQALGVINRMIDVQSATLGAVEFFWLSGFIFLVLIIPVWFSRPAKQGGDASAGAGAH